ncbi:hypothetical protein HK102_009722, partial [Quaeritorhiza haematococci]
MRTPPSFEDDSGGALRRVDGVESGGVSAGTGKAGETAGGGGGGGRRKSFVNNKKRMDSGGKGEVKVSQGGVSVRASRAATLSGLGGGSAASNPSAGMPAGSGSPTTTAAARPSSSPTIPIPIPITSLINSQTHTTHIRDKVSKEYVHLKLWASSPSTFTLRKVFTVSSGGSGWVAREVQYTPPSPVPPTPTTSDSAMVMTGTATFNLARALSGERESSPSSKQQNSRLVSSGPTSSPSSGGVTSAYHNHSQSLSRNPKSPRSDLPTKSDEPTSAPNIPTPSTTWALSIQMDEWRLAVAGSEGQC